VPGLAESGPHREPKGAPLSGLRSERAKLVSDEGRQRAKAPGGERDKQSGRKAPGGERDKQSGLKARGRERGKQRKHS